MSKKKQKAKKPPANKGGGTKGRNLVRYIDPSVITDPVKRAKVEAELAQPRSVAPKQPSPRRSGKRKKPKQTERWMTVALVLHDGTRKEWRISY